MKYAGRLFTLFFKVLFMSENSPALDHLREVQDIRRLMERSSRFTTLSGWSAVAAGVAASVGAYVAFRLLRNYYGPDVSEWTYQSVEFAGLRRSLILLAGIVFIVALLSAVFFTWRKTRRQGLSLWNHTSRRVFWNMALPLGSGILFVLGILQQGSWTLIAPACLVFYGLALVNAGKYTLADIRYLGYCEIVLGLINLYVTNHGFGYGLYFWTAGFGILHIVYGLVMWYKYDRKMQEKE